MNPKNKKVLKDMIEQEGWAPFLLAVFSEANTQSGCYDLKAELLAENLDTTRFANDARRRSALLGIISECISPTLFVARNLDK
jgi:hypothetical protein